MVLRCWDLGVVFTHTIQYMHTTCLILLSGWMELNTRQYGLVTTHIGRSVWGLWVVGCVAASVSDSQLLQPSSRAFTCVDHVPLITQEAAGTFKT